MAVQLLVVIAVDVGCDDIATLHEEHVVQCGTDSSCFRTALLFFATHPTKTVWQYGVSDPVVGCRAEGDQSNEPRENPDF